MVSTGSGGFEGSPLRGTRGPRGPPGEVEHWGDIPVIYIKTIDLVKIESSGRGRFRISR
jgi:hypothetical protein